MELRMSVICEGIGRGNRSPVSGERMVVSRSAYSSRRLVISGSAKTCRIELAADEIRPPEIVVPTVSLSTDSN